MSNYDHMLDGHARLADESDARLVDALSEIQEMAADAERAAELYRNADAELKEIDDQFSRITQLDRTDISFLMLATALQVSRWILIGKLNQQLTSDIAEKRVEHDDKDILKMEREKRKAYQERHGDQHVKGKHRAEFYPQCGGTSRS